VGHTGPMNGGDMVWLPWAGLGAALALLGAWWAGRRGDAPAAVRRVGYAIGVLGLWALGVPSLLYRLWAALSGWAARLFFNPLSWVGLVATAAAVLLVLAGLAWGRRHEARPPRRSLRREQPATTGSGPRAPSSQPDAVEPSAASPQSSEDAEIEAILRRRGIS